MQKDLCRRLSEYHSNFRAFLTLLYKNLQCPSMKFCEELFAKLGSEVASYIPQEDGKNFIEWGSRRLVLVYEIEKYVWAANLS